ncbi:hypothetical protein D049_1793A, partial [Vibrio parahaemolyticus VPTS-2010]|jgi:autophagy-related protein 2
MTF